MPRVGGGFDHCGLDGNDNYVSLSFAGSIQQLNPVLFPLQGRTGKGVTEVGLVPCINVGGAAFLSRGGVYLVAAQGKYFVLLVLFNNDFFPEAADNDSISNSVWLGKSQCLLNIDAI